MPIRVVPFDSIDAGLIGSLRERRVREDRTLDFKRDLNLGDRNSQSEFLKDVTAFANSSGGTLLYGVEEGQVEDEGTIVAPRGLELEPDPVHRQIDNLLRDSTRATVDLREPVIFEPVRSSFRRTRSRSRTVQR